MNDKTKIKGHTLAIFTEFIWSLTFISTKVLLETFTPIELTVIRFAIAYIALCIMCPKFFKTKSFKEESMFALAGLTGVTLYFILQNTALTYTYASNAGVIIATAPIFTVVLARIVNKNEERIKWNFVVGFVVALSGIFLISFNGQSLHLNPLGDIMMFIAALSWAVYTLVLKKVYSFGYPLLATTRRIFAWGLGLFLPCIPFTGFSVSFAELFATKNLLHFLFLGVLACAIGFATWNKATEYLGSISVSFYIYLSPVLTLVASAILLDEKITPLLLLGTVLALAGLIISEFNFKKRNAM